ncbi:MAG: GMC family oxidoreductase [Bacteroidota bacterium]
MQNLSDKKNRTFDAIVIGSGISGGWAAKELTARGLRTLVLERGRDVKHVSDYPTMMHNPWDLEHGGQAPLAIKEQYKVPSPHYIFSEQTLHFLVKDAEQEYIQEDPFQWMRGYQVGGRSLLWARQTQRWSDFDFEGPARDGFAVDWPIRYKDLASWYSYVEKFVGISGNKDGLANLPDGEFLKPHEMSCVESHFKDKLKEKYPSRPLIIGRCANLTEVKPIHTKQGRGTCQNRTLCERGCPYGGYFSSNSSTIPWAQKTGKLTIRPHSVVHSIIYDETKQKAIGVKIIDTHSMQMEEFYAKIIFLNASAIGSNLVLLNSISNRFPHGLGNDSGVLGKYLAFHNYRGRISADFDGFLDKTTDGKRPNGSYMPNFRNVYQQETDFLRGYACSISSNRNVSRNNAILGEELKNQLLNPSLGDWSISSNMMAETLPKEASRAILDQTLTDKYGIPQLRISVKYDENDLKILKDFWEQFEEMFTEAGFKNIKKIDTGRLPGSENHEMGGVRMGKDPKTSMLNKWNQLHAVKNVFVTDGACMTSTATQNPSLTYMAMTARAVDYAVKEMKALRI